MHSEHRETTNAVDPRLDEALRLAVAVGAMLLLLLPATRGSSAAIGWLPLWLLAMPLTAWWALHRFRLPRRAAPVAAAAPRRRREQPQARRRPQLRRRLPRAA